MTYFGIKAILAIIAVTVAGLTALARSIWGPQARARKRLRDGSAELADRAIVTLTGTVRVVGEPLVAPLSGKPCVIFTAVMQLFEQSGRQRTEVASIVEHEMIEFDLEVGEQVVRVCGEAAELAVEPGALIPRNLARERAMVDKYGHDRALLRTGVFHEAAIAPGDRVVVQGMAVTDSSPERAGSYRDDVPRYQLIEHPGHPLTIGTTR